MFVFQGYPMYSLTIHSPGTNDALLTDWTILFLDMYVDMQAKFRQIKSAEH